MKLCDLELNYGTKPKYKLYINPLTNQPKQRCFYD